jgi:hypothetical protein
MARVIKLLMNYLSFDESMEDCYFLRKVAVKIDLASLCAIEKPIKS